MRMLSKMLVVTEEVNTIKLGDLISHKKNVGEISVMSTLTPLARLFGITNQTYSPSTITPIVLQETPLLLKVTDGRR